MGKIIDVPVLLFPRPSVPFNPSCEVSHCRANVDIVALLEQHGTQLADLNQLIPVESQHEQIAPPVHYLSVQVTSRILTSPPILRSGFHSIATGTTLASCRASSKALLNA